MSAVKRGSVSSKIKFALSGACVDYAAFSEAAHLQDGKTILLAQTLGVLP